MSRRKGLRAAAAALGVVLVGSATVAAAPAPAVPGKASLGATPATTSYREDVRVGGLLETDAECLEAREVNLQRRPLDDPAWGPVAVGQTAPDGSFAFDLRPEESAAYRAVLPAETRGPTACEEVISSEATSRVWARVVLTLVDARLRASRCDRVSVRVHPPKPGDEVDVRRRRAKGWRRVATGILDETSEAILRVCAAWADLGTITLRARWPVQDQRNLAGTSAPRDVAVVRAPWMRRIDRLTGGRAVGISVREGGAFLYRRDDTTFRTPASNQKLFLSMALLDSLGPDASLPTLAMAPRIGNGVVRGRLWLVGRGDPELGRADLRRLARLIEESGVRRIRGGVWGSKRYFRRDWWAQGWRDYFPARYIPIPTALTYQGNVARGRHIGDPERRAALELTRRLRARGVRVDRRPGAGDHPSGLAEVARVSSRPLEAILTKMNYVSSNFRAEVLGKRLAVALAGPPGSIGKGAAALRAWIAARGATVAAYDASGLSYANRVAPRGIVRLLETAEAQPWGETLRETLPPGGRGTLENRLDGVPVRAKTGSLTRISALSGWILAERTGTWIEFSILSTGMSTWTAKDLEDRIVRVLWRSAA